MLKENCFVLRRIRISSASTWFVLNSKSMNLISLPLISKGIIPDLHHAEANQNLALKAYLYFRHCLKAADLQI